MVSVYLGVATARGIVAKIKMPKKVLKGVITSSSGTNR